MEEYLIRYRDKNACIEKATELGAYVGKSFDYIHGIMIQCDRMTAARLINSGTASEICRNCSMSTSMHIANRVLGVDKIRAKGVTGKGVGIAFIDTGIFPHPDFLYPNGRIRAFHDFVGNGETAYDDNGHGTFCAGVAAGSGYMSNGYFRGCAPGAWIISVKAMNENGAGESADVLKGIEWILKNARRYNIRVASVSIGTGRKAEDAGMINEAVEEMWKNGITVVAAAGNDGPRTDTIGIPGANPSIITVGAMDDKRGLNAEYFAVPSFSSRGGRISGMKPDILALGVGIISTNCLRTYRSGRYDLKDPYTTMSGTSVAAPMVAGVCALMIQKWPMITPDEIKRMLLSSAVRVNGDVYSEGRGRLQI